MATSITLCNVGKAYTVSKKNLLAIDNISFSVPAGGFFTILGPSGCGKSTIINLIAGFISPNDGSVKVNDETVTGPAPDRVIVSQEYGAFPWKTAHENVEFVLKASNIPKTERKKTILKYLEMVGIKKFANSYPFQLSSGMKRRLILARALAVKPECLLMDEPLVGLDMQLRYAMQEDISRIWDEERPTVIWVTHDLEEALYLSDRVLFMSPHPGTIRAIVDIPFSRPRIPSLRLTDDFQSLRRELFKYIA